MKVFVSGAGGYIGIPLCKELLVRGHEVVALDRFFFGEDKFGDLEKVERLKLVKDDIRYFDPSNLEGIDCVMDLAGLSNDATAEIDPVWTRKINYEGGERIAKLAKAAGVKRYIYSSSAGVYGLGRKTSLKETDEVNPQTAYAESKVHVETVLQGLQSDDFETVCLRNATVFGLAPRMRFDLAINIMTMRAWKEKTIYVMGGGEQWRPFVHVNDVVRCFIECMSAPASVVSGETFNVGDDDNNYQIRQIAQIVASKIPEATVHIIPDDPDKRTYNLSFEKLNNVLGFRASTGVSEGVDEIFDALGSGALKPDDPTAFTLQWYRSLIEWHQRISHLSIQGEIF